MYVNYHDLKVLVFFAEPIFGALLLWMAFNMMPGDDPVNGFVRLVLFIIGAVLMFFGLVTYLLVERQDPDIWR
jgi:hypothetical protein